MSALVLRHGDLAEAEADAIVNAWNRNFVPAWLLVPQGVSRALKKKSGKVVFQAVRKYGLLPLGGAVATGAGNLDARWVIHVAALHAYWRASERSVSLGYANAFRLAAELGARTVAMPLLGAGTGGLSPRRSYELLQAAHDAAEPAPERTEVWVYEQVVFDALSPEAAPAA